MGANYIQDPAVDIVPVTPHDTNTIDKTSALLIGVPGDLKVQTVNGNTRTIEGVPVGVLPIQVTMVYSTDTTADKISALY